MNLFKWFRSKSKIEKTYTIFWIVVLTIIISGLIVSRLTPTTTIQPIQASHSDSTPDNLNAIGLILLAGIWWLISHGWPYLIIGFGIMCFCSLVKDTIKDGVREGIEVAFRDYGMRDELKEMIKEAIHDTEEENELDEI